MCNSPRLCCMFRTRRIIHATSCVRHSLCLRGLCPGRKCDSPCLGHGLQQRQQRHAKCQSVACHLAEVHASSLSWPRSFQSARSMCSKNANLESKNKMIQRTFHHSICVSVVIMKAEREEEDAAWANDPPGFKVRLPPRTHS